MNLLLDTQVFLWLDSDPAKVSLWLLLRAAPDRILRMNRIATERWTAGCGAGWVCGARWAAPPTGGREPAGQSGYERSRIGTKGWPVPTRRRAARAFSPFLRAVAP